MCSDVCFRHSEPLTPLHLDSVSGAAMRRGPTPACQLDRCAHPPLLSAVLCHSRRRCRRWKRRRRLPAAGRGRASPGAAARAGQHAAAAHWPCSGRRLPSRDAPQQVKGALQCWGVCTRTACSVAGAGVCGMPASPYAFKLGSERNNNRAASIRQCIYVVIKALGAGLLVDTDLHRNTLDRSLYGHGRHARQQCSARRQEAAPRRRTAPHSMAPSLQGSQTAAHQGPARPAPLMRRTAPLWQP